LFAPSPRPTFGRAAAGAVPAGKTHAAKSAPFRAAQLAEASEVLAVLPGPGESLHALMTGRYDLMTLLRALIGTIGHVEHLRIATLSYSAENLREILKLLDAKEVDRVTLLCSKFFVTHNRELHLSAVTELRARGGRCAAARSHAKVVCIDAGPGGKWALQGSANLRSNSNQENLSVTRDDGLHDFFRDWLDALISRHEGEDEGTPDGACEQSPG
jgi:hypothetical protein